MTLSPPPDETREDDAALPPPVDAHHRRHRARTVGLVGAGVVLALVALAAVALFVLTNTDWGREQVRRRVVAALAGTVHGRFSVGRIGGNLLKGITIHDVTIADSAGAPFLKVDSARTRYGLKSFYSKRVELTDVTLWHPVIVLDRPPGGRWNYDRIFPRDTTKKDTTTGGWGSYLVLHDVRMVNGFVTVRVPWAPPDSLHGAARDSAVRVALDSASRAMTVRVPGGFQRVQEYQRVYATMPLVRIADPKFKSRRIEIDSARAIAYIFRPPPADIRQAKGAIELDTDSVWFRNVYAQLPGSRATLSGSYALEGGSLRIAGQGAPITLGDLHWLLPQLPEGTATSAFDVALLDTMQAYHFRNLDLKAGATTARGTVGIVLGDSVWFDSTNVTFANLDTRLIERLAPRVDIPRQGVLGGHLFADGTLAALRLDGDVTFDDPRTGRSRVMAAGELGAADGVVRTKGLKVTLAPMQVALARLAKPDLPIGGTLSGTALLDGSTATEVRARGVDLTHLDRGARSRVTGSVDVGLRKNASGTSVSRVDANVNLRPLSLAEVGRFAPSVGLRGSASGPVRARGTLDDLLLDASLRLSDGGALAARGRLDLNGTIGYDMAVTTRLFNARAVVAKAPVTSVTARATAKGRGTDLATMTSALTLDAQASRVDTVAVDSARARLRIGGGVLTVDALALRAPSTRADAVGTFGLVAGRSGDLTYRVAVDSLPALARYLPIDTGKVEPRPGIAARRAAAARADSAQQARRAAVAIAAGDVPPPRLAPVDTPRTVRRDSLAGAVYAAGVLRGNITAFDARGRAGAVGLVVLGNTVQRARVAYNWTGARTPRAALAVAAVADSVTAGGFALDSVDARLTYREPGGTAQVAVFQTSRRDVSARAEYAIYTDRKEVRFGDLRLRLDTTLWSSTRPGSLLWGRPGIEVRDIELTNGQTGRVYVDGRLPTEGPANLKLEVRDFQVSDVLGIVESDVELAGRIGVNATLTGTMRAPVIQGTATVADASYRGTAVPNVSATVDYAGGRLAGRATLTDSLRTLLTATGNVPVNLALQGVTGPRIAADATATVDARIDSLPLDLASRFTDAITNVRGAASGTLSVRGPLKKPTITGDMRVGNGTFRLAPLGVTMRDVVAAVHLRGDTVVIDSLYGYTAPKNRGRIMLSGGLGIKTPTQPAFDLRLVADNARVLDNEQGLIQANAQISMYGPFDNAFVSGGARVLRGVLYIPESDKKQVLSAGDPAVFAVIDTTRLADTDIVPAQSPLLANLRTDIYLGVDRDTWVRSREANVEIFSDGDLRIRVNRAKQAIVLDGSVNTDRGEYTFLSKRFQIKRGSATFVGTQELNPNLQLTGEYEVAQASNQPLAIRILIGGQLLAPRITLESDAQPPIAQSDLLSYLAFGRTTGQLTQIGSGGGSSLSGGTAGGGQVGTTARLAAQQLTGVALGVAVDQLESRTARSLGADVFNITPVPDIPAELASGNFGGGINTFLRGTQIEFGKYFNARTFVGLQATPTFFENTPPVPGFLVQYRFPDRTGLSLETSWTPRFFLPDPSLSPQALSKDFRANALSVFLVRRWRF